MGLGNHIAYAIIAAGGCPCRLLLRFRAESSLDYYVERHPEQQRRCMHDIFNLVDKSFVAVQEKVTGKFRRAGTRCANKIGIVKVQVNNEQ